jgi:hypothetical protein
MFRVIFALDVVATLLAASFSLIFYAQYFQTHYLFPRFEANYFVVLTFFCGIAGIFIWSRKWLAAYVFAINLLFMWTSHVLSDFVPWFNYQFLSIMSSVSVPLHVDGQSFADVIALGLTILISVSIYRRFENRGTGTALLRVVQLTSLSLMPLGLEILLFDRSEFNLHVSHLQQDSGLFVWFTNADLLLVLLIMVSVSSAALFLFQRTSVRSESMERSGKSPRPTSSILGDDAESVLAGELLDVGRAHASRAKFRP